MLDFRLVLTPTPPVLPVPAMLFVSKRIPFFSSAFLDILLPVVNHLKVEKSRQSACKTPEEKQYVLPLRNFVRNSPCQQNQLAHLHMTFMVLNFSLSPRT